MRHDDRATDFILLVATFGVIACLVFSAILPAL